MSAGQRRRLSNPENQTQYLYEARGESNNALDAYNSLNDSSGDNLARQHNLALLTYLSDTRKTTEQAYLTALKDLHLRKDKNGVDGGDLTLHQLVLSYNIALHSFFSRQFEIAEQIIYPIFQIIQDNEENLKNIRFGDIKCKIAFLTIDCMLEVYDVELVNEILSWVETYISARSESTMDDGNGVDFHASFIEESLSELKFRLYCYRARFLFVSAERDRTTFDVNTKKARKELKNAMEIYNHKLSGKKNNSDSVGDGTGSVQESVAKSISSSNGQGNGIFNDYHRSNNNNVTVISNGIVNGHDIDITDDNRSPFERKTSDTQYQHALYLKAKLEYLKGNTKKSLKLCSEAQNTVDRNPGKEMSSIHHAMFNNNVAVVHQTSGQFFLAMHYFAHALEHIENALNESECIKENIVNVSHDGTIKQISVKQVLYNAAICAQECGNYVTSSECMSRYLDMAHDYMVRDPFPWLHLAESCIGKLNSVPISFEYLWLLEFILTRWHLSCFRNA